jgi:hypothetical protein
MAVKSMKLLKMHITMYMSIWQYYACLIPQ